MTDVPALDPRLAAAVAAHPQPVLFATLSGAHLYGFPSVDSDWDVRGVHVLPLPAVLGFDVRDETVTRLGVSDGLDLDVVTHDVRKFGRLLLGRNGYALEQVCSPLVVRTSPWHAELRALAPRLVTRHHAHHYLGFSETQQAFLDRESPPRLKPLLYAYRVLLSGLHLMRTGEVEANLPRLAGTHGLTLAAELIARKQAGERGTLDAREMEVHRPELARWRARLEAAHAESRLPDTTDARDALESLVIRARLPRGGGAA